MPEWPGPGTSAGETGGLRSDMSGYNMYQMARGKSHSEALASLD